MPAAAVIPAPVAYIITVVVKKLVVEYLALGSPARRVSRVSCGASPPSCVRARLPFIGPGGANTLSYFEKICAFKAGTRYESFSME